MQNYYYKHDFQWILNFYTFLSSFNSCFFPYLYSLHHVLSYNLIHIHICRLKQIESCVWRTKEEWITETWMKGGRPCYSSWMFWSRITFPCHSVCPPTPSCHDHGRYFGQWNLSRGDILLPNGSIIFCPTSWNADIMTEDWAAMLDFFLFSFLFLFFVAEPGLPLAPV